MEEIHSVCNQSDYPTKVGFRIFCRISSDYEEYARSLSDFNIFDHIIVVEITPLYFHVAFNADPNKTQLYCTQCYQSTDPRTPR